MLTKAFRPFATCCLVALVAAGAALAESDPHAMKIAEDVLAAMGGRQAWEATRYLRFDFFGFRQHTWDRYTGRHRLEGKTRDGDTYLVLSNIQTHEGEAWLNGEKLTGDKKKEWLDNAYGAWVNDTYWLLMPYKLLDPGVHLAYAGEEKVGGAEYDKLLLTFDHVGLTPGDRYWAFINRETHLMDRWAYHLEGWEENRPATHWLWKDWQRYGRILLSPRRVNLDDGSERMLGDIAVLDQLPDTVFTSPEPPKE